MLGDNSVEELGLPESSIKLRRIRGSQSCANKGQIQFSFDCICWNFQEHHPFIFSVSSFLSIAEQTELPHKVLTDVTN